MATDMVSTLLSLAQVAVRFADLISLRSRIKLCSLCDSVLSRLDAMALRKDDEKRAALLDLLLDWPQDPLTVSRSRYVAPFMV
jgi:hypothetical protein